MVNSENERLILKPSLMNQSQIGWTLKFLFWFLSLFCKVNNRISIFYLESKRTIKVIPHRNYSKTALAIMFHDLHHVDSIHGAQHPS